MNTLKYRGAITVLALVLCALLMSPAVLAEEDSFSGSPLTIASVDNIIDQVCREYVEEVTPARLANGAIKGMKAWLEKNKMDGSFLRDVDPAKSRSEQVESLNLQIQAVHAKFPRADMTELIYSALRGMMESLDEYSAFMTPREYSELMESMGGEDFGGLGIIIEVDTKNANQLTIVEPLEGYPAFRAGIEERDMIMEIDGKSTKGMTIEEATKLIRGKVGTKVRLTIKRKGSADLLHFTLTREKIHIVSLTSKVLDGKIGYIRLRVFGERTRDELEAALRKFDEKHVKGVILDLRNNGGGYVSTAVDVCSKFLPTGSEIVSIAERTGKPDVYRSRPNRRKMLPMVLIVNGFSASASEITAGALQDHGAATVMGVTTYGKASVQKLIRLSDGSCIKLTIAHYLTPKGRNLSKKGLDPDVIVEEKRVEGGARSDAQLDAAVERLKKDLVSGGAAASSSDDMPFRDAIPVSSLGEEYAFIQSAVCPEHGAKYSVIRQKLIEHKGKWYDCIEAKCEKKGEVRVFIFDINEFFGR
jgi:carboxyl-terminal processing protease